MSLFVKVHVSVSPACRDTIPLPANGFWAGRGVTPSARNWSLTQVAVVDYAEFGCSVTAYCVPAPAAALRAGLSCTASACASWKLSGRSPSGPLIVKLKTVGSLTVLPFGSFVTLSTLILPGTRMAIPGGFPQLHLEVVPAVACIGLVQASADFFVAFWDQLKQVLISRLPSPLVSTQATSMLLMLE